MNESLHKALSSYLQSITGDIPYIEPADKHVTTRLPLFLRQKYDISRGDLLGRKCFFAFETKRTNDVSPSEYAQDILSLKRELSLDVVLVLSKVVSYVRNRLVRQQVPFIVPGTQMFLPMLMIDLRERFPKPKTESGKLTPVSQLIIIYHLLREDVSNMQLAQVALRLAYSPMAISQAQDQLQESELCEVVKSGRALSIHFKWHGLQLWQHALPLLSTPVRQTHWIRWGHARPQAVVAGLTAMAKYTMLADDSIPTFAMKNSNVTSALEKGGIIGCAGREDAEARMEGWKYDPCIVAKDDAVDPCSLYLTLRHFGDERVQKELETLIRESLK
jgi:hypothetical protein